MSLGMLLVLVVGGIAGIGLILHLTGHSSAFVIDSEETARHEWQRHCPDDQVRGVLLAPNRRAALITTDRGRGLLWSFGADTTAHDLAGAQLRPHPNGLKVILGDFAAPTVRLSLPPEARALWAARIEGTPQ